MVCAEGAREEFEKIARDAAPRKLQAVVTGGAHRHLSVAEGLESVPQDASIVIVHDAARPLGKRGVRINSVAPGNILFPGSTWERKLLLMLVDYQRDPHVDLKTSQVPGIFDLPRFSTRIYNAPKLGTYDCQLYIGSRRGYL